MNVVFVVFSLPKNLHVGLSLNKMRDEFMVSDATPTHN